MPATTLWAGPHSPRAVDAPALAETPDVAAWAGAMNADSRLELVGRALTQLLLGEPVVVVEVRGAWAHVRAPLQPGAGHPDGYPGWVPRHHLAVPGPHRSRLSAVVTAPTAWCEADDGSTSEISFGTVLPVAENGDDRIAVHLPGGGWGRLPSAAMRLQEPSMPPSFTADDVLDAASQFLGLGYLWGGTSAWGLDCSGLVHLVYRSLGVRVPRDAADQSAWAAPLPLEDARPGDLYFFARGGEPVSHVGFVSRTVAADGQPWMLHAPETGAVLEERPLAPDRPDTVVAAGRVRTDQDAVQRLVPPRG